MFTRNFVIILAVTALVGAGLGLVIASSDARMSSADPESRATEAETSDTVPVEADPTRAAQLALEPAAAKPASKPSTPAAHASPTDIVPASIEVQSSQPAVPTTSTSPASDRIVISRSSLAAVARSAKEEAAIATLRSISSAQAMTWSSGIIDVDRDTTGEYAYFAEMAGTVPYRTAPGDAPALLRPTVLAAELGQVSKAGCMTRSGYLFRMFLPGATVKGRTPGIGEGPGGGLARGARTSAENGEVLWAAYAWPVEAGQTGTCAYFINQEGDLFVTPNADGRYSGEVNAPAFDAAYSTLSPENMSAPLPKSGEPANDGRTWTLHDATSITVLSPTELSGPTAADLEGATQADPDRMVVSRAFVEQANRSANESAAITCLRSLDMAQFEFKACGVVDTDGDSSAEYGWLGELAGTAPCRAATGNAPESSSTPVIHASFGHVTPHGNVLKNGYVFRLYLPGATAKTGTPGIAQTSTSGGPRPDHDNCELGWAVYAWPIEAGRTGTRAFFCNQEGFVYVTENADRAYSGEEHAPAFDAAFSASKPRDMFAPLPERGGKSNDGRVWAGFGG